MDTATAMDKLYEKVKALVPEATHVSVTAWRQTGVNGPYTDYTVMVREGDAYMAHASCVETEAKAINDTMRQIEAYRTDKASRPKVCPTCGHKEALNGQDERDHD